MRKEGAFNRYGQNHSFWRSLSPLPQTCGQGNFRYLKSNLSL